LPFAVATTVYPTLADGPDLLGARFEAAQHVRVAGLAGGLCLSALLIGWAGSPTALAYDRRPRLFRTRLRRRRPAARQSAPVGRRSGRAPGRSGVI
jgi:hypothetical protein